MRASTRRAPSPRPRAAGSLVLLLLGGCAVPVEPTAFTRSQRIPLGSYTLTVSHLESTSAAALGSMGPIASGKQILALFFGMDGAKSSEAAQIKIWFMRFRLMDAEGRAHPGLLPLPAREYHRMISGMSVRTETDFATWLNWSDANGGPPRDWVFLFMVPEKARGFSLLVDNPAPLEGQARLASITLGR